MSNHPNPERGTTRVEDRATKSTAGTGIGFAVLGLIAGIVAVADWLPVMMGIAAVVLGLIGLVAAASAWKRAKDQTGQQAGTPATNLSWAGVAAGAIAVVLGVIGIFAVGEVTDVDEGVDQVEQEADELGDDLGVDG